MLEKISRLWDHIAWADRRILVAIGPQEESGSDVLGEFAHVIGSEENWLARLQQRKPRAAIWPSVTFSELEDLVGRTHSDFEAYIEQLSETDLSTPVTYTNSAGKQFTNPTGDILLHVALHGQYHRGKVNLMLRQAGRQPAPTDYIAFVRGVPAATRT